MLLDLGNYRISADPMQYSSIITLRSTNFQKICRDVQNLAEFIKIKVQTQLIFSCKGDLGAQDTILCDNESKIHSIGQKRSAHEIVQGVFSIKKKKGKKRKEKKRLDDRKRKRKWTCPTGEVV